MGCYMTIVPAGCSFVNGTTVCQRKTAAQQGSLGETECTREFSERPPTSIKISTPTRSILQSSHLHHDRCILPSLLVFVKTIGLQFHHLPILKL